jgi:hypothetical protein
VIGSDSVYCQRFLENAIAGERAVRNTTRGSWEETKKMLPFETATCKCATHEDGGERPGKGAREGERARKIEREREHRRFTENSMSFRSFIDQSFCTTNSWRNTNQRYERSRGPHSSLPQTLLRTKKTAVDVFAATRGLAIEKKDLSPTNIFVFSGWHFFFRLDLVFVVFQERAFKTLMFYC